VIIKFRNPLPCMRHAIYSLSLVDCTDYFPYLVGENPGTAYPICRENPIEPGAGNVLLSFDTNCLCTSHSHTRDVKLYTGVSKNCFHQFVNGVSFIVIGKGHPYHSVSNQSIFALHPRRSPLCSSLCFFQWAFFIII